MNNNNGADTSRAEDSPNGAPKKKRRVPWGLIVMLVIVGAGFFSCLITIVGRGPPPVEPRTVLELDLEQPLVETASGDPLSLALEPAAPTVRDVVYALDRASRDKNVVGVVARVGAGGHGLAMAQEVRDAVRRFRASGRFAVAFSETFGEGVPGNGGYYLATSFEEIWLQPSGDVNLIGLAAEVPFFVGALQKLDVEPVFSARGEYKSFKNQFTESGFTEAHEESLGRVVTSQQEQIIVGIAEGRGLEQPAVEGLLARGPFSAAEALQEKLVDKLGYRADVLSRLDELAGGQAKRLFPAAYLQRAEAADEGKGTIALLYATGPVVRGAGGFDPLSGGQSLGSDDLRRALHAAVRDDDVRAIVLRIDSPGGSYIASDAIRQEVLRAQERKKPVVASMGNVAGSGGYFIAMDADRIVAQPGTITGSIGVVSGKLLVGGLFEKLGVSFGRIEAAPRAGMYSALRPFSDEERQEWEQNLDRIYADFVDKAAEARSMPRDQLEQVARGRIWTGADAKARGLVDDLGGLHEAVLAAKKLADIDMSAPVQVRVYPPEKEPLEALLSVLQQRRRENSDQLGGASSALDLRNLKALWVALSRLPGGGGAGPLVVPAALQDPGGL